MTDQEQWKQDFERARHYREALDEIAGMKIPYVDAYDTEVRHLEAARKEAAAQVKGEIETLQGEIRDLVQVVRDRKEKRAVQCRIDTLDKNRFIYRIDTGELVELSDIDPADRQLALPLK